MYFILMWMWGGEKRVIEGGRMNRGREILLKVDN